MRVATVGDNCLDVYSALGQAYPGGNPVNVAVYLERLGVQASYTGVIGTDAYGKIMKRSLADKGIDISHLHTKPGNTAVTQVELVNGDRILGDYDEGVMASFKLSPEDKDFLCRHDILHAGIWGKIEKDLPELHKRGLPVSFDFADKLEDDIVSLALPFVDYAFFSYAQDDDFIRDYLMRAHGAGPRIVIATLGEQGSLAFDGQDFSTYGVVPVEVVDTMGAGDSFIAGFIQGILFQKPLQVCLALGAENASATLRYMGAWEIEPQKDNPITVAAIGDNCIDVYPKLGRQYVTGNAVDFAINIHQLGYHTSVISLTGNDENGQLVLDTLNQEGIDTSHLKIGSGPTAITMMDMNGTDRIHGDYLEGVLKTITFSDEDLEFTSRHTLIHTAFWGKADQHLERLRCHGALICFDYADKINDPLVKKTLPYVDYAFFSFKGNKAEAEDFLKFICDSGPFVAVATLGSEGSMAFDGNEFVHFGIYPAEVVNTVGAGDAFIAGFMAEVLAEEPLKKCLDLGAKIASKIVEIFKPWSRSK